MTIIKIIALLACVGVFINSIYLWIDATRNIVKFNKNIQENGLYIAIALTVKKDSLNLA